MLNLFSEFVSVMLNLFSEFVFVTEWDFSSSSKIVSEYD